MSFVKAPTTALCMGDALFPLRVLRNHTCVLPPPPPSPNHTHPSRPIQIDLLLEIVLHNPMAHVTDCLIIK